MRSVTQFIALLLVLLLAIPTPIPAAVNVNAIFEARNTSGSSANGGCFVPFIGTPSPSNSATLQIDSGTGANDLWVSSTSYAFQSTDVMKYMEITGWTGGTPGAYQILAVSTSPGGVVSSAELNASPSALGNGNSGTFSLYPGVDRSQQTLPQVTIDNMTITATSSGSVLTFTGSTYTPSNADDGNCVNVASGATAGVYYISNETTNSWNLSGPTLGTGSNIVAKMGGAMDTLATVMSAFEEGNTAWFANVGTYSYSAGVSTSQACAVGDGTTSCRIYGYNTARGDKGSSDTGRPVFQIASGSTGVTLLTAGSAVGLIFAHIAIDCNGTTTSAALSGAILGDDLLIEHCTSTSAAAAAITSGRLEGSEVTGNTGLAGVSVTTGLVRGNYIHGNSTTAVILSSTGGVLYNQITDNSAGSCTTCDGVQLSIGGGSVSNNTIAGNGRDGINAATQILATPISKTMRSATTG